MSKAGLAWVVPPAGHHLVPHAAGWLGSPSTIERHARRGFGRAMSASLALHVVFALLAVSLVNANRSSGPVPANPPIEKVPVIYLQRPSVTAAGGGGGSPAPAPRKRLDIPRHRTPDPVPLVPAAPAPTPAPLPALDAPIQTGFASVLQASGSSSVSIAAYGGGGRGGGIGSGTGAGVGPGSGGGFGGGAYTPGGGITSPTLLREVRPQYTSDAMRARIQGEVRLEAVVLPNGTIGDIRVAKSLDRVFGLDDEAIKAAREWRFAPGKDASGRPVPVLVIVILEFRLH